jgi:opacity protein-like surface antigen
MFVLACVLAIATPAGAQVFIGPTIGYDFGGDTGCPSLTDCQDKRLNIGVSVGAMGNLLGVEVDLGYAPDFYGDAPALSSSVLTAMGNVMLVPNLGPVRPYVLAGLGLIKTHAELTTANIISGGDNQLGWDVGGGLMGFVGSHVGLRADLRYFHAFESRTVLGFTPGDTKIDFARASVGLVVRF